MLVPANSVALWRPCLFSSIWLCLLHISITFWHTHMYIYIQTCTRDTVNTTCLYIYICIYMYIYIYVYICVCACKLICIYDMCKHNYIKLYPIYIYILITFLVTIIKCCHSTTIGLSIDVSWQLSTPHATWSGMTQPKSLWHSAGSSYL